MNLGIFKSHIIKLTSIYGEKSFPNAKIDAIWDISKNLSDYWFERTVTKLINTCKYAPMPSDFFEEAQLERARSKPVGIPDSVDRPHPGPMSQKTITLLAEWKKKNGGPTGAA